MDHKAHALTGKRGDVGGGHGAGHLRPRGICVVRRFEGLILGCRCSAFDGGNAAGFDQVGFKGLSIGFGFLPDADVQAGRLAADRKGFGNQIAVRSVSAVPTIAGGVGTAMLFRRVPLPLITAAAGIVGRPAGAAQAGEGERAFKAIGEDVTRPAGRASGGSLFRLDRLREGRLGEGQVRRERRRAFAVILAACDALGTCVQIGFGVLVDSERGVVAVRQRIFAAGIIHRVGRAVVQLRPIISETDAIGCICGQR